jgi:L-ribulose-5-phosphate 3-epimerase
MLSVTTRLLPTNLKNKMRERIGFMQGRLSPKVNGKIQAFPSEHWRSEFEVAASLNVGLMEWTLDQEDLYNNPFMTRDGQREILELSRKFNVGIPSLTGDCFMQAPFFKDEKNCESLLTDFENVIKACGVLGVRYAVYPLVDHSSIKTRAEEDILVRELLERINLFESQGVKVVFESDFAPKELRRFIDRLPARYFGINYDIGNSASLGFNPAEEFAAYGERIINVHVKDRKRGGTTVPLGEGDVDFKTVFSELKKFDYSGNFILQTARAEDGKHAEFVSKFTSFVMKELSSWN